jgi:hypothetical protein
MTALACQLGREVGLVGKLLTVILDAQQVSARVIADVAGSTFVQIVDVVTVSADVHRRKQVVSAGHALLDSRMAVGADEALFVDVKGVAEDEIRCRRSPSGIVEDTCGRLRPDQKDPQ